ncbi:MAG: alpha/beta fold hydrolase [Solirubrobacterales bacterium]
MLSKTRYARAGDTHIAYRTLGDGPVDLVVSLGFLSHVEHEFTEPRVAAFFERLAEFARVVVFDRRGVGLSDPIDHVPTLEEQVDDVSAVLDEIGSERVAMFGHTTGVPYALLFAASQPERVSHLVLASGFARMTYADDYPWANTAEVRSTLNDLILQNWGSGNTAAAVVPSLAADEEFREWYGGMERLSCAPGAARRAFETIGEIDVRSILPTVHQPTLVMHPDASVQIDGRHSHYLAEHIPNARFVNMPGADVIVVDPEVSEFVAAEVQEFVTGTRPEKAHNRTLRTILFTDIVDSTSRASQLGDREWSDLLDRHDALIRRELAQYRGREINTTGDGFFAAFDGPERAVRCALAINASVKDAGIPVRSGLHTGECEVRGEDLGGLAVHIGARVAAKAGGHEVLVSQTVRDLVVGSDLSFEERGEHELKGVPGTWHLFAAA